MKLHPIDGTTHDPANGIHACARIDVEADDQSFDWQVERARKMQADDPHCWVYAHNVGFPEPGGYSFVSKADANDGRILFPIIRRRQLMRLRRLREFAMPDRPLVLNVEDWPVAFKVRDPQHQAVARKYLQSSPLFGALWRPEHPRYIAAMLTLTRWVVERWYERLTNVLGPHIANYDTGKFEAGATLGDVPIVSLPVKGTAHDALIDSPEVYLRVGDIWDDHWYRRRLRSCTSQRIVPWLSPHVLRDDGTSEPLSRVGVEFIAGACHEYGVTDAILWRPNGCTDDDMMRAARIYAGARSSE